MKIAHISFADSRNLGPRLYALDISAKLEELPELIPGKEYAFRETGGKPTALKVLRSSDFSAKLQEKLKETYVSVAPVAEVYPIPPDLPGLSEPIKRTVGTYNYYIAELGLNVVAGREAKIPTLAFEVDLQCNGKDKTDATTFALFPDDRIEKMTPIKGKISLGISKLLTFIPNPVGKLAASLVSLDIDPIDFAWTISRCRIDCSGPKNYHAYWRVYDTSNVQSFNPIMILKTRKSVTELTAKVHATYEIKTGFLGATDVRTDAKPIQILPL
jgi:hypothetical protein